MEMGLYDQVNILRLKCDLGEGIFKSAEMLQGEVAK
jgi:hypothetical protein